ncbi:MAG TPA: hypothetical protein VMV45_01855, partial [Casimicrobiaceae bacterium]|nr:hypothetical protein [Casimicrobiaceae bacterium]
MLATSVSAQNACAMCGVPLAGPYCQACGQPSTSAQRSFREAVLGHTGRLAHTLKLLLLQPGELGREIVEARDRQSVRPLTLLLNLIAVFFLVGAPGTFTPSSLAEGDPSGRAAAQIEARAVHQGVSREVTLERLDRRFQSLYSVLILPSAFVYGGVLWLLHRRSGLSWLVHLAGAVHFLAFLFIVWSVVFLGARLLHVTAIRNPVVIGLTIV